MEEGRPSLVKAEPSRSSADAGQRQSGVVAAARRRVVFRLKISGRFLA